MSAGYFRVLPIRYLRFYYDKWTQSPYLDPETRKPVYWDIWMQYLRKQGSVSLRELVANAGFRVHKDSVFKMLNEFGYRGREFGLWQTTNRIMTAKQQQELITRLESIYKGDVGRGETRGAIKAVTRVLSEDQKLQVARLQKQLDQLRDQNARERAQTQLIVDALKGQVDSLTTERNELRERMQENIFRLEAIQADASKKDDKVITAIQKQVSEQPRRVETAGRAALFAEIRAGKELEKREADDRQEAEQTTENVLFNTIKARRVAVEGDDGEGEEEGEDDDEDCLTARRACFVCGKLTLDGCGICKKMPYCSLQCQAADYDNHRLIDQCRAKK